MKFYVSTALKNTVIAQSLAASCTRHGHTLTCAWWDLPPTVETAEAELRGITEADAVIVFDPRGRGTHVEFGVALALGKKVILVRRPEDWFTPGATILFYKLPQVFHVDENGVPAETLDGILNILDELVTEPGYSR